MKQRVLLVVWPDDHDECLKDHAENLQDVIDAAHMGGAKVIGPLNLHTLRAIEQGEKDQLP